MKHLEVFLALLFFLTGPALAAQIPATLSGTTNLTTSLLAGGLIRGGEKVGRALHNVPRPVTRGAYIANHARKHDRERGFGFFLWQALIRVIAGFGCFLLVGLTLDHVYGSDKWSNSLPLVGGVVGLVLLWLGLILCAAAFFLTYILKPKQS